MKTLGVILVALAGCAPPVRFADRAILWREPDDAPIPMPKENEPLAAWIGIRDALVLPADRRLALEGAQEAVNVNALDEVPDSSWYEDLRRVADDRGQIRMRSFSAAEAERGSTSEETVPVLPLTVVSAKGAGVNIGFVAEDARGVRYVVKTDPIGFIGMNTSTEVVCTRLTWAAGWKVPDEVLVDFRREDLRLSPKATGRDDFGKKIPMTRALFDGLLHSIGTLPDGTIRAVASKFIPGKIVGPFTYFGRRADDPNDRVPHEHRRDLRGFGTFASWINNIDTLETNTLDSYVGKPGEGHLVHWQQDVGGSFGSRADGPIQWWMGNDVYLAPSRMLASLFTLGAIRRPWDGEHVRSYRARLMAEYPELGYFDSETFDPRKWWPVLDNPAFERQTARDRYWGAKRVLAVSAEELRGAVRSGRYRPQAEARLIEILTKRRDKVLRAFLGDVAALDFFHFDGDRLCFDDLWVVAGFGGQQVTEYAVKGAQLAQPQDGATQCVGLQPQSGYRVVELKVKRAGERKPGPAVRVHFVEGDGPRRIIGIER
jgi:hypothetical protein